MSDRVFSVILLPTSECNVACDYCFEHKEKHRLSRLMVPLLTKRLLEHMKHGGYEECEIYWQGGEAMLMGPQWFADTGAHMARAAHEAGKTFTHYLQTNLISYSSAWKEVILGLFQGELGTSMDYPNPHRKLFSGSAEGYTDIWTKRLKEAQRDGIEIGVIAVLHQGSIDIGAEAFYRYYTEELGLDNFQVNTPFPGGPANEVEGQFRLDNRELAAFLVELFDVWMERGFHSGVKLGPFDALMDHFQGQAARLPCIWKENCSNQFISVDSKGTVAQCDCWVTSYPEYFFGNIFQEPSLTRMLETSPARRAFVERPGRLVEDEDCLECRYLSICHGGCPVRAYSATGSLLKKDPYCEVYKAVFHTAETHAQKLLRRRKSSAPPDRVQPVLPSLGGALATSRRV
ncbi:radical SAM protein [Roseimicrobium sp. ORNL1]|uniref:radical SAM protein n=1 Tax=Roseimicrobium sp. ORNL1 TaxID=2711231 RepID=UPI0013E1089F|nr:radical SAM protein [Roseimicrobium sp. ORNL1]QIF02121.1 radical SAM protein [Roseimicrobium sp. ORNL1]